MIGAGGRAIPVHYACVQNGKFQNTTQVVRFLVKRSLVQQKDKWKYPSNRITGRINYIKTIRSFALGSYEVIVDSAFGLIK